jgi:RNA polymerase sigma-70 factor, ECF subfamily
MQPLLTKALARNVLDWKRRSERSIRLGRAMAEPLDTSCAHTADLALVRGVLAKDASALEEFAERSACVPAFLRRLVQPAGAARPIDIEDLSQDVFATVWSRLGTFDGRCQLETWLWGFCRKRALKWLERGSGEIAYGGEDSLFDLEDGAEHDPGREMDLELLRTELERLERSVAEVVHLKHFDELTFPQIGKRLGVSPNTAKTRYYRGLDKLKARLGSLAPSDGAPDRRP